MPKRWLKATLDRWGWVSGHQKSTIRRTLLNKNQLLNLNQEIVPHQNGRISMMIRILIFDCNTILSSHKHSYQQSWQKTKNCMCFNVCHFVLYQCRVESEFHIKFLTRETWHQQYNTYKINVAFGELWLTYHYNIIIYAQPINSTYITLYKVNELVSKKNVGYKAFRTGMKIFPLYHMHNYDLKLTISAPNLSSFTASSLYLEDFSWAVYSRPPVACSWLPRKHFPTPSFFSVSPTRFFQPATCQFPPWGGDSQLVTKQADNCHMSAGRCHILFHSPLQVYNLLLQLSAAFSCAKEPRQHQTHSDIS